jgi:serine/threonine-protein kinase
MELEPFLHHLRRSRLVTDEQIKDVVSRLPDQPPPALARALVDEGSLTAYQAEQLLRGNSKGFLLGPYRITDYLGRGGLACVFRAVHTVMDRVVALKVFWRDRLPADLTLTLLRWEARALSRLSHPNIVAAYDAGRARGVHYLALECVAGPSLRRLVRRRGPLSVGLACALMRQLADALQHAHDRGITHRDVKPANLVIGGFPGWRPSASSSPGDTPTAKLLDFTLAHVADAGAGLAAEQAAVEQALGDVCGTPEFMSPEQARGGRVIDVRSDLYNLGCTLYYALAGRPPFTGTTAAEVLIKHAVDEADSLARYRPDVPVGLRRVVRRLMAKDPAVRFGTPAEVVRALEPWCAAPLADLGPPPASGVRTWPGSDHETGGEWDLRSATPAPARQPVDVV